MTAKAKGKNISLTPEELEMLKTMAAHEGRNTSNFVQKMIRDTYIRFVIENHIASGDIPTNQPAIEN